MTVTVSSADSSPSTFTPRRRERRQALGELLTVLARRLDRRNDISLMRSTFEEVLRRIVPVRSIQLRERAGRWAVPGADATHGETITVEVPSSDPASHAVLEATFDSRWRLGQWDFQMLGLAAHVGALVLEIEGTRTLLARSGLLNGARAKRDGAAPLIGSTLAMQTLRSTIERVACTDFMVLLEGPSSRQ